MNLNSVNTAHVHTSTIPAQERHHDTLDLNPVRIEDDGLHLGIRGLEPNPAALLVNPLECAAFAVDQGNICVDDQDACTGIAGG